MQRIFSVCLVSIVLLLMLLPGAAAQETPTGDIGVPGVDLAITDVEVTQGTQDLDNSMKLIRKRRTLMRVYVRNNSGTNVSNIRARVRGYEVNSTGTIVQDLGYRYAQNNPVTVKASGGNRLNLNDSFWFYLPYSWRSTSRLRLDIEINYNNAVQDFNPANNTTSGTVVFHNADPLNLIMTPMHVHKDGDKNKQTMTFYCGPTCKSIYKNVLRYHPISTINMWYLTYALTPVGHVFGKEWDPAKDSHESRMLDRLAWKRLWTIEPAGNSYYYGMLHVDWKGNFGRGRRPGYVSVGSMNNTPWNSTPWYIRGGLTMAHELGHNKGLKHANCSGTESAGGATDPAYPWSFPNCSLAEVDSTGFYGTDVYYSVFGLNTPTIISNNPNVSTPNRGFPMMGYETPRWVSPWEYCKLMPQYGTSCSWPVATKPEAAPQATVLTQEIEAITAAYQGASGFLMISGIINDTTGEVELNPFYHRTDIAPQLLEETINLRIQEAHMRQEQTHHHADGSGHIHQGSDSEWMIVIKDATGQTIYRHQVMFNEDDHDATEITNAVTDILPMPAGATSIQVLRDNLPVAQREISQHAPQVEFTTSLGSTPVQPGAVITWNGSDADDDALVYTLLYSPDGGRWLPLGEDLPTTAFTITDELLAAMPGSTAGTFRVIASDGVNTASDQLNLPVIVADKAPEAIIITPEGRQRVLSGSEVILEGFGLDAEDGQLDESALHWESSLDGVLGTGSELDPLVLSDGNHTVTLTVTDSAGQTHQVQVQIVVQPHTVYLPHVTR